MNSFLFANLSMGCEILKIIKQPPNGSKTVHYLRLASRTRGLLGSARTEGLVQHCPNSASLKKISFSPRCSPHVNVLLSIFHPARK
jgi:hypothetical protein